MLPEGRRHSAPAACCPHVPTHDARFEQWARSPPPFDWSITCTTSSRMDGLPPRRARKFLVVLAAAACAGACGRVDRQQYADAVRRLAAKAPSWVERTEYGKRIWSLEQKFYEQRNYLPAWIDGDDPTPRLDALLQALGDAELHGLEPSRYGVSGLVAERRQADEATIGTSFDHQRAPELDPRFTYALLQHAGDL